MFKVSGDTVSRIERNDLKDLDVMEREDLEQWIIEEPEVLGEDLLVVSSEMDNYETINERLDVLALDRSGKIVVIELKRDRADKTTDLQALKYASYIATFSAEDVQKEYREFHESENEEISPEEVGEKFAKFLDDLEPGIDVKNEGYADFQLDDKPRIMLVAGEFGKEVTAPAVWLNQEYGMDFSCIELSAYSDGGDIFLNSRQILPVPETEDYMAKRRQKKQSQESTGRSVSTFKHLFNEGVLDEGDLLEFSDDKKPDHFDEQDVDDSFFKARVTGKLGKSNNIEWLEDGKKYSLTGLARKLLMNMGKQRKSLNGSQYWTLEDNEKNLLKIRREKQS